MDPLFLGFDAGTQSVKVAVYDTAFNAVAQATKPTLLTYPKPGWVEMNVDHYVEITIECIQTCVKELKKKGYDPAQIQSIMGDGIICGICGVDKNGNAVTPYINYLDSRTKDDAAEINSKEHPIFARETGNPEAKCLFPALFARWFLKNSNEFKEKGVKFMHNAPYILAHLAGVKGEDAFIDWGTMSGWGLGYDVTRKIWSDEQLRILGINKRYMPKICKPWDVIGYVTKEIALKTGLKEGTAVCAGAGDTMQSMLGCGLFEAGRAVDVAGTCAMFCVSTTGIIPELSKKGTGLIFNSGTLPDTYFYWGFIRTGGLALRWFKDNLCQKENDSSYYQTLSEGAAKVDAGCHGVLFLPYLTEGTGVTTNASGAFLNLSMDDDVFVAWRSVLEAIGYDYMEITDTYRAAGVDLTRISVTEGGSRDTLWNQIKSDMLGSAVVRYKASGGAILTDTVFAAYGVGVLKNPLATLASLIHEDATYTPNQATTKRYRRLYAEKKLLVENDLKSAFDRLKKMREL